MNIREDLGKLKQRLKELAEVINAFKSESVQLKVLEFLLAGTKPEFEGNRHERQGHSGRRKSPKKTMGNQDASTKPDGKVKRVASGRGSFALVSSLIDEGFFKTPRTIGNVIDHCGTHKGHRLKANEVSPALLRLLRNETLTRKKNKDNQYEYAQK